MLEAFSKCDEDSFVSVCEVCEVMCVSFCKPAEGNLPLTSES